MKEQEGSIAYFIMLLTTFCEAALSVSCVP